MKKKIALFCGVAFFATANGNASTIKLVDQGGVTGSPAALGFAVAADYWSKMFTNTAVINLDVQFGPLGPGIIGSTSSRAVDYTVQNWENGVLATKSNSAIDGNIVLPTLKGGAATFITNGVDATGTQNVGDAYQYVTAGQVSSTDLSLNSSVVKAIGGTVDTPGEADGSVTFSSSFGFDFDPRDGISANTIDFIGVAIHEIGHALGFVSGVDYPDVYGSPKGPGAGVVPFDINDTALFSALDMFRYSRDPNGLVPGNDPVLDLTVGGTPYFSVDGGATALFGNSFATGLYNGDGDQASHWKDTAGCAVGNGIMDPTFCYSQTGAVTGLDLAAFDAIGWNLSVDALTYSTETTGQIYQSYLDTLAVPEPATWTMMVVGFGMLGGAARRRSGQRVASV
ncbi:NF038122 family metalloprotease [Sphingomonas sp. TREG-RG-20F-R18-01]|uniref:NF038122 family metalloprotease n=1 Tax=Sphingomonas sp. TREG-RG-20F-R18-01 TaxID=2914982 RepID=UPI001F58566E|nr:NF038122 family metalloprotease [Sphingomonas sp. TREG-RG-20F-R18-01]